MMMENKVLVIIMMDNNINVNIRKGYTKNVIYIWI